jgi:HSP20 family protein
MSIIRWRPLEKDFNKLLENLYEVSDLPIDLYEENDSIGVEMAIAGINPDNIEITVEDNSLRITGERQEEEKEEDKNYYRKEIKRGSFERLISLPASVVPEEAYADVEDGVLKVILPKKKASKGNKVKIVRR